MQVRHLFLLRRLSCWPRDKSASDNCSGALDPVQLYLAYLILALDTSNAAKEEDGSLPLEDAAAAEAVRAGFVQLMDRYLRAR